MAELKAVTGVEVKDADQGIASVVFSTYNTIDSDGDVTLPGAFEDKAQVVVSAYGHATWGPSRGASFVPIPPIGTGVIHAGKDEAVADLRFFIKGDNRPAKTTFEVIRELGDRQQWSYGYDTLESDKGKFEGESVRFLKKLKVHEVSPVLLGAGVGTRTLAVKGDVIPGLMVDEDGNHTFELTKDEGSTFADDAETALARVKALIDRSEALAALRAKEGRVLSAANRTRLSGLVSALGEAAEALSELLADSDPDKHRKEFERAVARYELLRLASIQGGQAR